MYNNTGLWIVNASLSKNTANDGYIVYFDMNLRVRVINIKLNENQGNGKI